MSEHDVIQDTGVVVYDMSNDDAVMHEQILDEERCMEIPDTVAPNDGSIVMSED